MIYTMFDFTSCGNHDAIRTTCVPHSFIAPTFINNHCQSSYVNSPSAAFRLRLRIFLTQVQASVIKQSGVWFRFLLKTFLSLISQMASGGLSVAVINHSAGSNLRTSRVMQSEARSATSCQSQSVWARFKIALESAINIHRWHDRGY